MHPLTKTNGVAEIDLSGLFLEPMTYLLRSVQVQGSKPQPVGRTKGISSEWSVTETPLHLYYMYPLMSTL